MILKTFVVDVKFASGNSMEPIIQNGDWLVVWKLAYGLKLPNRNTYLLRWASPKAGDIVLFPIDNRFVVKKCVASCKDEIELFSKSENDDVFYYLRLTDRLVDLNAEEFRNLGGKSGVKFIPQDMVLVLGENLVVSVDSRNFGFLSCDSICGKVLWM